MKLEEEVAELINMLPKRKLAEFRHSLRRELRMYEYFTLEDQNDTEIIPAILFRGDFDRESAFRSEFLMCNTPKQVIKLLAKDVKRKDLVVNHLKAGESYDKFGLYFPGNNVNLVFKAYRE